MQAAYASISEQQANRKAATEQLGKLARLIRHRTFAAWLAQNDSARFSWATPEVYTNVNGHFMRQAEWELLVSEAPLAQLLDSIAQKVEKAADLLHDTDNPDRPRPATRFTFPRDQDRTRVIHSFCRSLLPLGELGLTGGSRIIGEARTIAYALRHLAASRLTLEHCTGHAGFEAVLETLTADYLLEGSATLVLGDCAEVIRDGVDGQPVTALMMCEDRPYLNWYTAENHHLADHYRGQAEYIMHDF